jgi:predicted nucleic acid-binding protein
LILIDSSAWILLENGAIDLLAYFEEEEAAICPPVYQEVLQGLGNPRKYLKSRIALLRAIMLDAPLPLARFEEAAHLYLKCRKAAFTIRRSTDCLIAACALAYEIPLLHDDRDFDHIAEVAPLKAVRV